MSAKKTTTPETCPCGRGTSYEQCCGRWHAAFAAGQGLMAPDAESLMRSRYSAFVRGLNDYLLATWHPRTRPATLEANEPGLQWLGLEVRQQHQQDASHATVSFVARSRLGGRAHRLVETSRFVKEDGAWYYVEGDLAV